MDLRKAKEIPILKKDDGWLDVVQKLLTITGVVFGAWAYFHTIHPVFMRESELQQARGELAATRKQNAEATRDLTSTRQKLDAMQREVVTKQEQIEALTSSVNQLKSALGPGAEPLLTQISKERSNAARAYLLRVVDQIGREAIDEEVRSMGPGGRNNFDLRARCLQIANEGLQRGSGEDAEQRALRVLNEFATEKLKPGSHDPKPLYEIYVYSAVDARAKALLEQ